MLLFLAPLTEFDRQPTTMHMIEYQRVQHALPDGSPDLKAKDNFYYRTDTTWYVMVDTDAIQPDVSGNRHLHTPEFKFDSFVKFKETGRPRGELAQKFTEIWDQSDATKKPKKTGWGTLGAMDYDYADNNRTLSLYVRTVVERVEVHTVGRRRAERSVKEAHWGVRTEGGIGRGPIMVKPESTFAAESGPHVRVDPVTYGYEPVVLPKDDEF